MTEFSFYALKIIKILCFLSPLFIGVISRPITEAISPWLGLMVRLKEHRGALLPSIGYDQMP